VGTEAAATVVAMEEEEAAALEGEAAAALEGEATTEAVALEEPAPASKKARLI
jgi:hypothetical protein